MVKKLWTAWYEYMRDHPEHAFRPVRVGDEDSALEVWMLAPNEADFPGMVVIHPWRVRRASPEDPWLQPPPYVMTASLEATRHVLPASALLLEDVPLIDRYCEAWLL